MKLRATGRGRGYSVGRGILESALAALYTGDWPARLWARVPASHQFKLTRHRLTLPKGEGRGVRLVFVSDLHVGPTTPLTLLQAVFEAIHAEKPDVLLLGGDFVFLEATAERLRDLQALVGSVASPIKLAVLGNHDLWTRDAAITDALAKAGARVLINETVSLPHPLTDVAVIGLDDPWTGRCDAAAAAAQLDGPAFRVVLCHSPDGLGLLSGLTFDLFLAGHTHGGQIASPWGPIVLPHGRLCREFPSGFGRFASGAVYVSRGVGAVELPMRTFSPPDILVIDLVRPRDDG